MYYAPFQVIVIFIIRLIEVYYWILLLRVLLSWFIQNPDNKFYHFLYSITEPLLAPIRRILPSMGLDISPIILFLLLRLISGLLYGLI
ncbi:MAG TPA: YggT family protein [Candidatus Cloacimonadota bacterium]|mgnify:CR=1 FL=1|nr:YggT family protein [Candidatus Cloacimonadota bacterium]